METWVLGALAGGTAALAMFVAQRRTHKTRPEVLSILRDRGPLTIPEIMRELGLEGMGAQGRVVAAIDQLVMRRQIDEQPIERDVPRMERIHVRKYRARAA